VKAIQRTVPTADHIRSGLHLASGVTTKPIERSHVSPKTLILDRELCNIQERMRRVKD
jgi:hypothetical protein